VKQTYEKEKGEQQKQGKSAKLQYMTTEADCGRDQDHDQKKILMLPGNPATGNAQTEKYCDRYQNKTGRFFESFGGISFHFGRVILVI